jgi:hypothetical protein
MLAFDICQRSNQVVSRLIAIDPGQGRICTKIFAVRCRLKNPFQAMLKNTSVFLLGLSERLERLFICVGLILHSVHPNIAPLCIQASIVIRQGVQSRVTCRLQQKHISSHN